MLIRLGVVGFSAKIFHRALSANLSRKTTPTIKQHLLQMSQSFQIQKKNFLGEVD